MPYWLLTSTTYGTWLPGDPRGSVTSVRDVRPGEGPADMRREHAVFGEAFEPANRGLYRSATEKLKGPPIRLTRGQAEVVIEQFRETCEHRGWRLFAAAVMANHFHVVVGSRDEADGRKVLTDLKAYATRALNQGSREPRSGRWWTSGGSRRRVFDEEGLAAVTHYVLHRQPNPLAVWPTDQPTPSTEANN